MVAGVIGRSTANAVCRQRMHSKFEQEIVSALNLIMEANCVMVGENVASKFYHKTKCIKVDDLNWISSSDRLCTKCDEGWEVSKLSGLNKRVEMKSAGEIEA